MSPRLMFTFFKINDKNVIFLHFLVFPAVPNYDPKTEVHTEL